MDLEFRTLLYGSMVIVSLLLMPLQFTSGLLRMYTTITICALNTCMQLHPRTYKQNIDLCLPIEILYFIEDCMPSTAYDPAHPDANRTRYVDVPNVNMVKEIADVMSPCWYFSANDGSSGGRRHKPPHRRHGPGYLGQY